METTISLLVQKSAKLLADVTVLLMHHKFRIRDHRFVDTETDGQSRLIMSIYKGDVGLPELAKELSALNGVLEVEDSGAHWAHPDDDVRNKLSARATSIAVTYPNIVGPMHDFERTIEEPFRAQILFELGEKVGAKVYATKFSSVRSKGSLARAMKKVVLHAVSPFLMAEVRRSELYVSICPFCHDRQSQEVYCSFLAGFISGLLNATHGLPDKVQVTETSCKARGDSTCTFVATESF